MCRNIFRDHEYILVKINFGEIIILEASSGKYVYYSRSNNGKWTSKYSNENFRRYSDLLAEINHMSFEDIESILKENVESLIPSSIFLLYMNKIMGNYVNLNSGFFNEMIGKFNNNDFKDFAFENKLKETSLLEMILCGLLYHISKNHLTVGIQNKEFIRGNHSQSLSLG